MGVAWYVCASQISLHGKNRRLNVLRVPIVHTRVASSVLMRREIGVAESVKLFGAKRLEMWSRIDDCDWDVQSPECFHRDHYANRIFAFWRG